MTPLFKKLNLGVHQEIMVLNAPASFEPELGALSGITIHRSLKGNKPIAFALAFVQTLAEIATAAVWLSRAKGDAVIWFAYPKQSSRRFKCEFNRDNGWALVEAAGFETVRQVAIDEDWSALRFRRAEFVKSLGQDKSSVTSPKEKKSKPEEKKSRT